MAYGEDIAGVFCDIKRTSARETITTTSLKPGGWWSDFTTK